MTNLSAAAPESNDPRTSLVATESPYPLLAWYREPLTVMNPIVLPLGSSTW